MTRRFRLDRDTDITGVSGTGTVADGVVWPDGTVSIRWRGDRPSAVFWNSIADAEAVHGHGGATRIVWDDLTPGAEPHRYLSTGCLHGEHGYCQSNTGSNGQKVPATCKFCSAPCECPCHAAEEGQR